MHPAGDAADVVGVARGQFVSKKEKPLSMVEKDSRTVQRQKTTVQEGERRRLEYVATLHPQEREALDPQSHL